MTDTPTITAHTFALPASVTIENVETVAKDMLAAKPNQAPVFTLDASKVETLTTPGVQVILSLAKTVEQSGGLFLITGHKAPFTQAFGSVGLSAKLAQWGAI